MDKVNNDIRVYSDLNALQELRGQVRTDPEKAKHEVAQQFESLFIQMVMRSMRDASKSISSDMLSSHDMEMYEDMFDKQLSLSLSQNGIGLAKAIEENLDRLSPSKPAEVKADSPQNAYFMDAKVNQYTKNIDSIRPTTSPAKKAEHFASPKEFINHLWQNAKQAATAIGTQAEVLLAQAALETNWGSKIIKDQQGSSHNLFNIKSDANWGQKSIRVSTFEHQDGVIRKEKANFKSYASFKDSFDDYTNLIKGNPRYQKALDVAHEPEAYLNALQQAGYASDQDYANKIKGIMESANFKQLVYARK